MAPENPTDEAVAHALAPLRALLAADDFHLTIEREGGYHVSLTIAAGPTACPTCLVPKDVTRRLAERHLVALDRKEWTIGIGYPADVPD